jgi:hypothetical protein
MFAVLMLAPVAGAARASGSAAVRCPAARSHVLRSDGQATVYEVREYRTNVMEKADGGYEHYRVPVTGIRGCALGRARSYLLGEPWETYGSSAGSTGRGVSNLALAGRYVAFEESVVSSGRPEGDPEAESSGKWLVVVRDLLTGKVVHRVPTGALVHENAKYVGVGPATAIVVKGDGSVAWIAEENEHLYQVHALDTTGSRLLASGSAIKPYTLGLNGSELYWSENGKRMSTTLN